jgi:SAM-dependent methyltransferase
MSKSPSPADRPSPAEASRWARFAADAGAEGPARAAHNSWLSHVTSLGYMLKIVSPPSRVISIGCGTAMFDILLAGYGFKVTSLDSDPHVLEAAARSAERFDVKLDLRLGDAFDLKEFHDRYDLAFSAGLVEHWNGSKTVELVAEHARCAPLVQVEVPTRHTLLRPQNIPDVMDDTHLYKPREFARRVRKAGLTVEKVYMVGSVPTRGREILESVVPPVLFRRLQRLTGYGMAIGCIARR